MKVMDLKPKMGKVELVLEIVEKGEPKEFTKFGSTGSVCNAKGKDETGEVAVTLWNEQIAQVNVGDKIQITNGYVSEYQGEMQLSTGKFGQLRVLGKEELAKIKKQKSEGDEEIDEDDEGEAEGGEEIEDFGDEPEEGNFEEEFIE